MVKWTSVLDSGHGSNTSNLNEGNFYLMCERCVTTFQRSFCKKYISMGELKCSVKIGKVTLSLVYYTMQFPFQLVSRCWQKSPLQVARDMLLAAMSGCNLQWFEKSLQLLQKVEPQLLQAQKSCETSCRDDMLHATIYLQLVSQLHCDQGDTPGEM